LKAELRPFAGIHFATGIKRSVAFLFSGVKGATGTVFRVLVVKENLNLVRCYH
jgi:hypothetical protein